MVTSSLFTLTAMEMVAMLAFALTGSTWLAIAALLGVFFARNLAGPLYSIWLNEQITDSSVRATVLSISGQANAIGQAGGGPVLGVIGNVWGIRSALRSARSRSRLRSGSTAARRPRRQRARAGGAAGRRSPACVKQPPPAVLSAFAVRHEPLALAGGQGTSWRAGDTVLKPLDMSPEELEWQAHVLEAVAFRGVRTPRPVRAEGGSLIHEGWCAWEYLEGRAEDNRWGEVLRAGECFHRALQNVPRPSFLDARSHPWAIADRVAWGALPLEDYAVVKHLTRLANLLRPLDLPSQVIHGDLTQNVLFAHALLPAVIDFSPYWRPAGFGAAVVVADAVGMELSDETILAEVAHVDQFPQLFVRAVIYRAVTDRLFRLDEPIRPDESDPYLRLVELAERLVAAGEW